MTIDVVLVPEREFVVETANDEIVVVERDAVTSIIEVVETIVETADPQIDVLEVPHAEVVIETQTATEVIEVGTGIAASTADASVPIVIAAGETFRVPTNRQVLFAYPMTVDGEMQLDGVLVEVL